MKLQESGEMYLETILVLKQQNQDVHAVMVAQKLGFSKPSVSRALGILTDTGYIYTDNSNHIQFTEAGEKMANAVYKRHSILSSFLKSIGVSEDIAEDDACRIEHVISEESMEKIKEFNDKLSK